MRADDIGLLTVAFSPVEKLLATGGLGSVVRLWDPGTGELVRELDARGSGQVVSTVFSPDGKTLAVSGSEGNVSLWDVATGAESDPRFRSACGQPGRGVVDGRGLLSGWQAAADDNGRRPRHRLGRRSGVVEARARAMWQAAR